MQIVCFYNGETLHETSKLISRNKIKKKKKSKCQMTAAEILPSMFIIVLNRTIFYQIIHDKWTPASKSPFSILPLKCLAKL